MSLIVGDAAALNRMLDAHGIDPMPDFDDPEESEERDFEDLPSDGRADIVRVQTVWLSPEAELEEAEQKFAGETSAYLPAEGTIQEQIGVPGTRVIDGRIVVEHNVRLRPYLARGRMSEPGEFERMYRTDPLIYKHCNELSSLVANAIFEPQVPESERDNAELVELVKRADATIQAVAGRAFREDAMTCIRQGFAPFEVTWNRATRMPHGVHFREQSTIYKWLFDLHHSHLIGASFETGGDAYKRYVLPHGRELETARLLLVNIGAVGLNVEGIPPLRPIVALRKLKEMLLQVQGMAAQKFGLPFAVIVRAVADAGIKAISGGNQGTNDNTEEVQKAIDRLENLQSRAPTVVDLPVGADLKYMAPTGDMPSVKDLLDYIDTSISIAFSNEGTTLGQNSFGSYAMAAVADSKFLRASPYYAEAISRAYNWLMARIIDFNYSTPHLLSAPVTYGHRFAGTQDSTAWIEDTTKLWTAKPWEWPEPMRRQAALNVGLPADTFDEMAKAFEIERAEPLVAEIVDEPRQPAGLLPPGEPETETGDFSVAKLERIDPTDGLKQKIDQPLVGYVDTAPGSEYCSQCIFFDAASSSCSLVDGLILDSGWCKLWDGPA